MILVDTSIWADHFRHGEPVLQALLRDGQVLIHPFIIGELALGNLSRRAEVVNSLRDLPQSAMVSLDICLAAAVEDELAGSGIGFVDANLLLSVRRDPTARLWTRDKRLAAKAMAMNLAWSELDA